MASFRRKSRLLPFVALLGTGAFAQNPRFHVFLAFGQSNMEGAVNTPEAQDKVPNPRFLSMSAVTCSGRTQGQWIQAVAPLVRCDTKLSPVDWFGRTMADSLPSTDTVGVVAVAVAGSKIEGFDLSTYQSYYATQQSWMTSIVNQYGGNPYARLVAVAKEAQKRGPIQGILLHQGESNAGESVQVWGGKVKKIYESLLKDLGIVNANLPLLAGEVAPTGVSKGANTMIDGLPSVITTAKVVSSAGLTINNSDGQNVHFDAPSYRTLGKRYAQAMLPLLPKTSLGPHDAPAALSNDVDFAVYDLSGALVARIHDDEHQPTGKAWESLRHTLPAGVYWIRGISGRTVRALSAN